MDDEPIFPFGKKSTPRPPREPKRQAKLFVLGVYPSAVHVEWTPPSWAQDTLGIGAIRALAVDDEPEVFWTGADATARVEEWKVSVGFRSGDDDGDWGQVASAGNGTSGRPVEKRVVEALGLRVDETWFSDAVNRFYVKSAPTRSTDASKKTKSHGRQQANAIADVYAPFATAVGLPQATLPPRPSITKLVQLAVTEHRDRLRGEFTDAAAATVVTLGEEARARAAGYRRHFGRTAHVAASAERLLRLSRDDVRRGGRGSHRWA